jgi:hypothetical protein
MLLSVAVAVTTVEFEQIVKGGIAAAKDLNSDKLCACLCLCSLLDSPSEANGALLAGCHEPGQNEYDGHRSYGSGIVIQPSKAFAAPVFLPDHRGALEILPV